MRTIRTLAAAAGWAILAVLAPLPSSAQTGGVEITTPYPAVSVGPGGTVSFDLRVTAPTRERVNLVVTQRPRGWSATLRGGGFVIDGVFTQAGNPPDVRLDIDVPAEARSGRYRVTVRASSGSGSDTLELDLRVAGGVGGGVELTTEFPSLQGSSTDLFPFDLQLSNNTPQEARFSLETAGPEGWLIDARPSGQQQASTVTVAGGSTAAISVEVDPPDGVEAGDYVVGVRAVGGGTSAEVQLAIQITGNFLITLSTPDERLNADVTAGGSTDVELVVINDGTAPLTGVTLSGTPPTDWQVVFSPDTIDLLPPGETANVIARITPSGEALAGDYIVTLSASAPEVSDQVELRTTVKTSGLWGVVGILLIVAALAGLGWVFRRYGRR
jgi:uncharacterized membrane protein